MEVVLADGSIVNANNFHRPDLFRALKGGSNNFGIVTRFDLETYPQGQLWGGFIAYPSSIVPQILSAFEGFMQSAKSDPYAEILCAIGYVGAYKSVVVSTGLHYTKAVANPPMFQPFTAIQPQLKNLYATTLINCISWNKAHTVFPPSTLIQHKGYLLKEITEQIGAQVFDCSLRGWESRAFPWPEDQRTVHPIRESRRVGDRFTYLIPSDTERVDWLKTPDYVLGYASLQ